MKHSKGRYSIFRLKPLVSCLSVCMGLAAAGTVAAQTTGYTGVYGGGPLYKHVAANISEIENSGFSEVIVWSVEVSSAGDLNLNAEFPLTSGGTYVGNNTWPSFAADLVQMKQGTPKRITLSIGSSNVGDWQDIKALVNAQGTGTSSILYKDFAAIKAALPAIDTIDFDDENSYDSASTVAFAVMLGNLGYHVTISPYTNASYWTSVVSQINTQLPGTVDGVHLQAYSGGAGNSPCSGWNFGSVPVFPGLADSTLSGGDTPPQVQSQMTSWHSSCGITGGFLWLYDDVAGKTYNGGDEPAAYANAINVGVGAVVVSTVPIYGIYSDGTSFTTGGLDGNGYAYSSALLGIAQSWNGNTFSIGSANTVNAWSEGTITLPQGQYSELSLLATGINGGQASQTFQVNYTDGTSTLITQSLSDWYTPSNYTGESKAVTMAYRDTSTGTKDNRTFYLYGYSFPINNTKTVASLTLPSNRNVVLVSYALSNPGGAPTSVNLASYFDRIGIYTDGSTFASTGGLDDVGDAYSATLLGSSQTFNNIPYQFGAANANNDLVAAGQTITLPGGQFSTLHLLATAENGNQTSQAFTVTYTDGTKSTFTQSMSDWFTPQSYAGELQADKMAYRDTYTGAKDNRTFYLYNYNFTLNNAKTVQSVTLPNNANVQVMAMTLSD
ncbi:hypothetical protein [Rhodanobacter sp. DHG33]|uniref:hypothetical protein n=1 Tax=Rhodanobacter sp. DHG33 TaxID=2775921 RepID=UPI001785C52B|nr:hypothetical protein [Rhodanobacter sp. DHG33]MBD8898516.1 hypothetical protein [Rhodanobacter sp. DHG33]